MTRAQMQNDVKTLHSLYVDFDFDFDLIEEQNRGYHWGIMGILIGN
jgi:hypothetical protein